MSLGQPLGIVINLMPIVLSFVTDHHFTVKVKKDKGAYSSS